MESRPGDATIARMAMQRTDLAKYLLLGSLVLVFVYFGVDKLIHPNAWIGWMPLWLDELTGVDIEIWLYIVGVIEFILGVLLLLPFRKVRLAALAVIILHLLAVIVQIGWNDVAIRDIAMLANAGALMLLLL
jgi:uncharacterized membrane protein YphA (DoxX/SURF4 family)